MWSNGCLESTINVMVTSLLLSTLCSGHRIQKFPLSDLDLLVLDIEVKTTHKMIRPSGLTDWNRFRDSLPKRLLPTEASEQTLENEAIALAQDINIAFNITCPLRPAPKRPAQFK